jgi:hypothetical protein
VRAVWTPDGRRIGLDAAALVPVARAGFYRGETAEGTNTLFAANLSGGRECRIRPADALPLKSKQPIDVIASGFRLGFEPWIVLAFLGVLLTATEWVLFHRRIIE